MAKYFFDKYEMQYKIKNTNSIFVHDMKFYQDKVMCSDKIEIDKDTGRVSTKFDTDFFSISNKKIPYYFYNEKESCYSKAEFVTDSDSSERIKITMLAITNERVHLECFLKEENEYPLNGIHEDGYIYVRQGAYPPTNIKLNINYEMMIGQEYIKIEWTPSEDKEHELIGYFLEMDIDSSGWQFYGKFSTNTSIGHSKSDILMKGTKYPNMKETSIKKNMALYKNGKFFYYIKTPKNVETITFRMRALDNQGLYSDWSQSEEAEITNIVSEPIIRIDKVPSKISDSVTISWNNLECSDGVTIPPSYIVKRQINTSEFVEIGEVSTPDDGSLPSLKVNLLDCGVAIEKIKTVRISVKPSFDETTLCEHEYIGDLIRISPGLLSIKNLNKETKSSKESFDIKFDIDNKTGKSYDLNIYLNHKLISTGTQSDNKSFNISIPQKEWFILNDKSENIIKVEAFSKESDDIDCDSFSFKKELDGTFEIECSSPILTDTLAEKIIIFNNSEIPKNASVQFHVCNNGFDDKPAWEDCTSEVLKKEVYNFKNKSKTSPVGGICIKAKYDNSANVDNENRIIIKNISGAFS